MPEALPLTCAACGEFLQVDWRTGQRPSYCPNCGNSVARISEQPQEEAVIRQQQPGQPVQSQAFREFQLPRWDCGPGPITETNIPDVRIGSGSETLAVLALLLPLLVECVFLVGTFTSHSTELLIGCGTVVATAILLTIDAVLLGTTDLHGNSRPGIGLLFFGMLLLWVVIYPVA